MFVLIKECIGRATKFVISENHRRTGHLQIGQALLKECTLRIGSHCYARRISARVGEKGQINASV